MAFGERFAIGAAVGRNAYYPDAASTAAASFKGYSSASTATAKSTYNVPLGHHDSDLSSVACHIGLGRRRDLTMREDLCLWKNGATKIKLGDVFRVRASKQPVNKRNMQTCCCWLRAVISPPCLGDPCCTMQSIRTDRKAKQGDLGTSSHVSWLPVSPNHHAPCASPGHTQGAKALLVGFPGGKVCTEQHIPGYVAAVS